MVILNKKLSNQARYRCIKATLAVELGYGSPPVQAAPVETLSTSNMPPQLQLQIPQPGALLSNGQCADNGRASDPAVVA